ncbi:protein SPO16 homolog [Gigantopelta aegis]|uniref:protein SPO16 homolog n=1 Tax=Gigantopelta aegis TaxID=1735272 RepID=UPI001B88A734|nr:protein SPO16 homolog [Gigantopelta aegis]
MEITQTQAPWPVIIHQSLEHTELGKFLAQKRFKLRISETVTPYSIIFPKSGVAFLYVNLSPSLWNSESEQLKQDFINSIDKFVQVHRNCYFLAQASQYGEKEFKLLSAIQLHYLLTTLQIVPIHNASDGVKAMINIAKLLCKPVSDLMNERFRILLQNQTATVPSILKQLHLDDHQIQMLQDGVGSLATLASATRDDLLDCCLDSATANRILEFFKSKQPGLYLSQNN